MSAERSVHPAYPRVSSLPVGRLPDTPPESCFVTTMQMLSVIAMLGLAALASAQTTAITGYHWVGETGSLTEKYNWKVHICSQDKSS